MSDKENGGSGTEEESGGYGMDDLMRRFYESDPGTSKSPARDAHESARKRKPNPGGDATNISRLLSDMPGGLSEVMRLLRDEVQDAKEKAKIQALGPQDAHSGKLDEFSLGNRVGLALAAIGIYLPSAYLSGDPEHFKWIIDQVIRVLLGSKEGYNDYLEAYQGESMRGLTPPPLERGVEPEDFYGEYPDREG